MGWGKFYSAHFLVLRQQVLLIECTGQTIHEAAIVYSITPHLATLKLNTNHQVGKSPTISHTHIKPARSSLA